MVLVQAARPIVPCVGPLDHPALGQYHEAGIELEQRKLALVPTSDIAILRRTISTSISWRCRISFARRPE
jgi:hypothetical protein